MHRRACVLVLCIIVPACGPPLPPACPTLLPATHLDEGYCTGSSGYCFFDHPVPF